MMHGRLDQAGAIVTSIEHEVMKEDHLVDLPEPGAPITIVPRGSVGFGEIAHVLLRIYASRALVGFSLMVGQAFLYNAIYFTYALVLTTFYGIDNSKVGLYLIPFAIGNILGPLTIGRLFDTIGRRAIITSPMSSRACC
jgi:predicted MFS family arabinose efflux permease